MKEKNTIFDASTITLIVIAVSLGLIIIVLLFANSKINKLADSKNSSNSSESKKINIDIEKKIAELKEIHPNIEYESSNIPNKIILVYKNVEENNAEVKEENEERYDSIIIDTKTGKELAFLNLIKKDKINEFYQKEIDLLNLKYPEFIVNTIKNNEGIKRYYVKDSEVIIYYYGYQYDYNYSEQVTLKIDYNEIKDLINFKPTLNQNYENENGYNYKSDKKTVALTFDDGPSGKYNPLILQELAKNKSHATFFMVGKMMNSYQNCVLQTYKSGNEIGSHTYDHMNIKKGPAEKVNESLTKTDNLYNSITGDHIKLLRPPYGAYSKENLETINNAFILWNLDTEDWRYRESKHVIDYIKENVHDGAIILMHELYDSSYEALKTILPWLYANGYQVVSVSELAKIKGRNLETGKAYLSLR